MIGLHFNSELLVDFSSKGINYRADMVRAATHAQTMATIGLGVSAVLGVASLISVVALPEIAILGTLACAALALGCREVHTIAGNTARVFKDIRSLDSIFNRIRNVFSAERFVDQILSSSWIIGPLFRNSIIAELQAR